MSLKLCSDNSPDRGFFRKRIIAEYILIILFLSTITGAFIVYGDARYRYPYEAFFDYF